MSNSVRPHRWQPTRLPHPWDPPGKNTGVSCHFLLQCMKVKSEREVSQSCPTLKDPMDCSLPGSSSMGFSRQDYWSWVPLPSPGDLPNPGIEPRSPALQADTLTSEPPGKPLDTVEESVNRERESHSSTKKQKDRKSRSGGVDIICNWIFRGKRLRQKQYLKRQL